MAGISEKELESIEILFGEQIYRRWGINVTVDKIRVIKALKHSRRIRIYTGATTVGKEVQLEEFKYTEPLIKRYQRIYAYYDAESRIFVYCSDDEGW